MELLLNVVWVLLALPAYWLWRGARDARAQRGLSSLQCLLALAGVLVLLFPVVSATDDLHAMRAEMEESSANRKNLRAAGPDRGSPWNSRWQNPVIATLMGSPAPVQEGWLELSSVVRTLRSAPLVLHPGRAPPVSLLS